MNFTTGKVIKVMDRGVLVLNSYGDAIRVLWDDVMLEDRKALVPGVNVIVHESGGVEIASSSFTRYRDHEELQELNFSNEKTFALYDDE